jgi:hypothetical protein
MAAGNSGLLHIQYAKGLKLLRWASPHLQLFGTIDAKPAGYIPIGGIEAVAVRLP